MLMRLSALCYVYNTLKYYMMAGRNGRVPACSLEMQSHYSWQSLLGQHLFNCISLSELSAPAFLCLVKLQRKLQTFISPSHFMHSHLDVFLRKSFVPLFFWTSFPSSSGFCENFAGHGGSDPAQTECSAQVVDSASVFLDINSNGDLVTQALADLDLNGSIGEGGRNNDDERSVTSCDTAELLRTPSPCVILSDQEAEPDGPVEARNNSSEEHEKHKGEQVHWAAVSAIHQGKCQEGCEQVNTGIQSLTDMPATSTPKKQKVYGHKKSSEAESIMEGRFEGSGYHRDGTRIGRCQ